MPTSSTLSLCNSCSKAASGASTPAVPGSPAKPGTPSDTPGASAGTGGPGAAGDGSDGRRSSSGSISLPAVPPSGLLDMLMPGNSTAVLSPFAQDSSTVAYLDPLTLGFGSGGPGYGFGAAGSSLAGPQATMSAAAVGAAASAAAAADTAVGIALRAEALRRASVGQMPRPLEVAERGRSAGLVAPVGPGSGSHTAPGSAYSSDSGASTALGHGAATGAFSSSMRYAAALAMSDPAGFGSGPGSAGRSAPSSSTGTPAAMLAPDGSFSAVTRTTSAGLASPPRPPMRSGYSSQIAQGAMAAGGVGGPQADHALRRARVSRRRTSLPSPAVLTASQLAAAIGGASTASVTGAEEVGFTVPALSPAQLGGSLPASPATLPHGAGSSDASPTRNYSVASSEPCSAASSVYASPEVSRTHPQAVSMSTASSAGGSGFYASPSGGGSDPSLAGPPALLRTSMGGASTAGTIRSGSNRDVATTAAGGGAGGYVTAGSSTATPVTMPSSPVPGGQGQGPASANGRRTTWSWDAGLAFTPTEGAGVSACEEAGYTWGSAERGVRGKAGTPGFWAPEMLYYEKDGKGRRYDAAADWWSLGCLIYALLASRGPFTIIGGDTADDNAATLQNDPDLSAACFTPHAASLLRGLLEKDPAKRLGSGPGGASEVMAHPFFAGVDWVAIKNKQLRPPFKPMMNVLESTKPVRGWNEKDKAKLAATTVSPADQVSRDSSLGLPNQSSLPVHLTSVEIRTVCQSSHSPLSLFSSPLNI